jgi:DNA helicase-2/ATP-dependent DNA helicase PcrA
MDFLSSLNPPQRQAVTHGDGPLLILAGAGSGKTRVLTHRIAHLLGERQVAPREVLAVTFTNKAAGEMKKRVEALVGAAGRGMWIGTFHSICVRILRREADTLGYNSDFVIYDRDDQLSLIKNVMDDYDVSDKLFPPRQLIARISKLKNDLTEPDTFARAAHDFREQKVAKVYQEYQRRLQANNAFDFDDLIVKTVRLFQQHPATLQKYQARFKHILVDEYQDTNHCQYQLVNLLGRTHTNVCVVGDDDQSIYGWRGADVTNILNFDHDFPQAAVVRLEQNYRSVQSILQAASAVIKHNHDRKEKTLWSDLDPGDPLQLVETNDEKDEAAAVVVRVKKYRQEQGAVLRDMVVLYRTNAQSRALEEEMRVAGIPYTIVGGLRFYERKEIKDILAYLKLLVNPRDTVSLKRVINTPRREIGGATINALEAFAFEKGIPLYETFPRLAEVTDIPQRKKQTLDAFWQLIERYTALAREATAADLTTQLLSEIGYAKELEMAQDDPESAARLENIEELLAGMGAFAERAQDTSLRTFLSEVSLLTDIDAWDPESDMITLMTLHCAKGLEFPIVFIAGMEEGLFPMARANEDPAQMEEERRLFYVGLTRAKRHVVLLCARQRHRYEQVMPGILSRFVREIPPNLLQRDTSPPPRPQYAAPESATAAVPVTETASYAQFAGGQYQVGMRVRHASFGVGEIVMRRGVGDNTQVTVNFRTEGQKKLLVKYAKLEMVR